MSQFRWTLAAVYGMHFLLTWNCTHIANAEMSVAIERVCHEQGFACPVICTPEELMGVTGFLRCDWIFTFSFSFLRLLQESGFDVVQRYEALRKFYLTVGFNDGRMDQPAFRKD